MRENGGQHFRGNLTDEVSELVRSSVKCRMKGRAVSREEAERENRNAVINEEEDTVDKIGRIVMIILRHAPDVFTAAHGAIAAAVPLAEAAQRGCRSCCLM